MTTRHALCQTQAETLSQTSYFQTTEHSSLPVKCQQLLMFQRI